MKLQYRLEKDNVFYTYQRFYNPQIKDSITKAIEEAVVRELRKVITTNSNVSEENSLPEDSIRALNLEFKRLPMEVVSVQGSTLQYRKMNLQGQISRENKALIETQARQEYDLLAATPGMTAANVVAPLNTKLKEVLGEPMITIGKVSYSMHPMNPEDEFEQDLMSTSRIEEEQRLRAEAFKLDLISMQRRNSALSDELAALRNANLALDQRLAHLTRELDEELEKNLQDFTQNNPDTRQNIQKQPVSEEKPAPNSPNRHRFMALDQSMSREGMSQVRQANYPFS